MSITDLLKAIDNGNHVCLIVSDKMQFKCRRLEDDYYIYSHFETIVIPSITYTRGEMWQKLADLTAFNLRIIVN